VAISIGLLAIRPLPSNNGVTETPGDKPELNGQISPKLRETVSEEERSETKDDGIDEDLLRRSSGMIHKTSDQRWE
jgi:hypothetical protein